MKHHPAVGVCLVVLFQICAWGHAVPAGDAPPKTEPKIFEPDPGTQKKMADGLALARQSGRRLLVIYEGGWCALCPGFHKAIEGDASLTDLYRAGYVEVAVSTDDFPALREFAQQQHADLKKETGPLLAVIEQDGSTLDTLTAKRLLDADRIAPAKIKSLLERWRLGPPAQEVVQKALPALSLSGKLGWVEFRADWCGWCRKMDKLFETSAASAILAKYFVMIRVDYERNAGAVELARRLGSTGDEGLPWFAVVDAAGKPLATSHGPKGNVGYPGDDGERAYFRTVLQSTAKGITSAELDSVDQALKAK